MKFLKNAWLVAMLSASSSYAAEKIHSPYGDITDQYLPTPTTPTASAPTTALTSGAGSTPAATTSSTGNNYNRSGRGRTLTRVRTIANKAGTLNPGGLKK